MIDCSPTDAVLPVRKTGRDSDVIPTGSLVRGYSSVDIMRAGAIEIFGLDIPQPVYESWHSVMEAITYLDAIVDGDYGYYGDLDYSSIIDFLRGEDEDLLALPPGHAGAALRKLRLNMDITGLETEHRLEFLGHAAELALAHEGSPDEDSVQSLTEHRLYLGRMFGQLFVDVIPDEYKGANFAEFEEWITSLGACSEVVDSMWDLKDDYNTGKTLVSPTARHRAELVYYALPEARIVIGRLTPRFAGKLAVKAALFGINRSGRFNEYRTK